MSECVVCTGVDRDGDLWSLLFSSFWLRDPRNLRDQRWPAIRDYCEYDYEYHYYYCYHYHYHHYYYHYYSNYYHLTNQLTLRTTSCY